MADLDNIRDVDVTDDLPRPFQDLRMNGVEVELLDLILKSTATECIAQFLAVGPFLENYAKPFNDHIWMIVKTVMRS